MILRRVGKISKMERSHKTVHRKGGKVERKIGSLGVGRQNPPHSENWENSKGTVRTETGGSVLRVTKTIHNTSHKQYRKMSRDERNPVPPWERQTATILGQDWAKTQRSV